MGIEVSIEERPSPEAQVEEHYEDYAKEMKWSMIRNKVVQENGLKVSNDEIVNRTLDKIMGQFNMPNMPDEMRESSMVIGEGRDDVDTIATSLSQIRGAVSEAANRAEEIFHGADTHTRDVERMVSSMDEIARVAESNAEAIVGVVASTQRQVTLMSEMDFSLLLKLQRIPIMTVLVIIKI